MSQIDRQDTVNRKGLTESKFFTHNQRSSRIGLNILIDLLVPNYPQRLVDGYSVSPVRCSAPDSLRKAESELALTLNVVDGAEPVT